MAVYASSKASQIAIRNFKHTALKKEHFFSVEQCVKSGTESRVFLTFLFSFFPEMSGEAPHTGNIYNEQLK